MPLVARCDNTKKSLNNFPLGKYQGTRYEVDDRKMQSLQTGISDVSTRVCAFVPKKYVVPAGNNNYKINTAGVNAMGTLDESIRGQMNKQIIEKQVKLVTFFVTGGANLQRAELAKVQASDFGWPDPANISVNIDYDKQLVPADATGFSIGDGLVATAGHVVTDAIKDFDLYKSEWYIIFGLKGRLDQDLIPSSRIYTSKRLVFSNYNRVLRVDPTPIAPRYDMNQAIEDSKYYDFAIMKVEPLTAGNTAFPAGLRMLPYLPISDNPVQVYAIGHPSGLPQKVSWGGTVCELPEANRPLMRQGSLTADLDTFKGNSGCPMFIAGDGPEMNNVVGACRSGDQTVRFGSSNQVGAKPSTLYQKANAWSKTWNANQPVDDQFLSSYEQLQTYDNNTKVAWQRALSTSDVVRKLTRFTRVDPFAYFSQSLATFAPPQPFTDHSRPYGTVQIDVRVILKGDGTDTLQNPAASIAIFNGTSQTMSEVATAVVLPNHEASLSLKLDLGITPARAMSKLARDLQTEPSGLCGWESLLVARARGPADSYMPYRYEIMAVFTIANTDPSPPTVRGVPTPRWVPGTEFVFRTHSQFPINQMEAIIGVHDLANTGKPWEGPVR